LYAPPPSGWRGLGADPVYCLGYYVAGGAWQAAPDGHSLTISPDDQPGKSLTLVNLTPAWGSVENLIQIYAGRARVIFSGFLLSDGRFVSNGGAGSLGANEFAATRGPDPSQVPSYITDLYPLAPAPAPDAPPEPPPPPPAPAWTGEQSASVQVTGGGIPENVRLFAADGTTYKLASASDATNATELATTAPQGPALTVTGRWDPAGALVAVTGWYITELGPGEKQYRITPEGNLGPQSPDYPSTDWPGGLPEEPGAAEPGATPGAEAAPSSATVGLVVGLGLLVAMLAGAAAGRRR